MAADLLGRIARRIADRTGLRVSTADIDGVLRVVGAVPSEIEQSVVEEIVRRAARGGAIECVLRIGSSTEIEPPLPVDDEPERLTGELIARLLGSDAQDALGTPPAGDDVHEGGEPYFPPTDPVVAAGEGGALAVVGGFAATSMDDLGVAGSFSNAVLGDEALVEAVGRKLREDAATTDLPILVDVRAGVAYLTGRVAGPEDAENAEVVAASVLGVRDVVEQLTFCARGGSL